MSRTRWKEQLKDLPALSLGELASDPLRLLFAGLAHRDGLQLKEWLDLRLRSLAVMALPTEARNEVLCQHIFDVLGVRTHEIDYAALSSPSCKSDVPDDQCLWQGVFALANEVDAAIGAFRLQRSQAAQDGRRRRQHRLWQAPIHDRPKSFGASDGKQLWHKQLNTMGQDRNLVRVTARSIRCVEQLLLDAPNFREPTLFVLGQLALVQRRRGELRLPPILLVGPPAAGKTWWAQQVAEALGVHCEFVALPSVSASFELTGGNAQWKTAMPGRIVRTFLQTQLASPVFVLDEIDKTIAHNSYPVAPTLLGLVDRVSSAHWRDEFFDMEFDVSRSVFIATANYPNQIDAALRSRFRRIDVRGPNRSERAALIASIWRHYRKLRSDLWLPTALGPEVIEVLAEQFQDARQTLRLFDDGLGRAARRRGPLRLFPADVGGAPVRPCPAPGPLPG